MAEVWYNVGHVAIGSECRPLRRPRRSCLPPRSPRAVGDVGLAYQAFRVAVNVDSSHAESFNNLGVLEMRKANLEAARNNFGTAQKLADLSFEPFYNGARACSRGGGRPCFRCLHSRSGPAPSFFAVMSYKLGDFQEAYTLLTKAISNFPDHGDSQELMKVLKQHLTAL